MSKGGNNFITKVINDTSVYTKQSMDSYYKSMARRAYLKYILVFIVCFILIGLFCLSSYAEYTFSGVVTGVHDGDTITVRDKQKNIHKVRLACVDTPEYSERSKCGKMIQPFGKEAKEYTEQLLYGQEFDFYCYGKSYDRDVCLVSFDTWIANDDIIQNGYGFWYNKVPYCRDKTYKSLENNARQNKLGLWGRDDVQEPWVYRKAKCQ